MTNKFCVLLVLHLSIYSPFLNLVQKKNWSKLKIWFMILEFDMSVYTLRVSLSPITPTNNMNFCLSLDQTLLSLPPPHSSKQGVDGSDALKDLVSNILFFTLLHSLFITHLWTYSPETAKQIKNILIVRCLHLGENCSV